jgi:hypothetical protein
MVALVGAPHVSKPRLGLGLEKGAAVAKGATPFEGALVAGGADSGETPEAGGADSGETPEAGADLAVGVAVATLVTPSAARRPASSLS